MKDKVYPQNIVFKIKNEKLCVWMGDHECKKNCIFSSDHPLIQKFFTSLSSIKEMEIPDVGNLLSDMKKKNLPDSPNNKQKTDLSELDYLPCLIFPKQDLRIRKYNRLIRNTKGLSDDHILSKCKEFFTISEIDETKGFGFKKY
jgi:uncharacterized protein (DUF1015 family)